MENNSNSQRPKNFDSPALDTNNFEFDETGKSISQERLVEISQPIASYLKTLFRKSGVMDEESHRPILTPSEDSYISKVVSVSSHLLRYWIESPSVQLPPPETLNAVVSALRRAGIEFESTPEDVAQEKELLAHLLNRAAKKREHTSRLHPQTNRAAVVCAWELINLLPVMAEYNGHELPNDYSVEMSLYFLANDMKEIDEGHYAFLPDIAGMEEIFKGLEPDSSGYIRLDEFRRSKLQSILEECGAAVSKPTPESINEGIEAARELVNKGRAEAYLKSLSFIKRETLPENRSHPVSVLLEQPIYINPEAIAGANSFEDWTGRKNGLKQDDLGDKKTSLEVIEDYATRGSPLPQVELSLLLQENKSLIIYADNSHRAAAARLRSEPLAVTSFDFFK